MDEYALIRQIGKGAFGSAHIVESRFTHKRCVLKRVRLARQTPRERQASLQEIQLLSQMHHRNILAYMESWVDKGFVVCIVVELCEGGDLRTQLQLRAGRYFAETDILEMFVQLASALEYMHRNCIIHRDIKTSNILIASDGRLVLADFGLSTVLESPEATSRTIVGTPGYMSPQLLQRQPYDSKVDVWALGCVFHEITSLKPAFDAFNMPGLIKKVTQGPTPQLPGSYSEEWRGAVRSMLQKDVDKRPSASELLAMPFFKEATARVEAKWGMAQPEGCSSAIHWEAPPPPIAKLAEKFKDQEAAEVLRRRQILEAERQSYMPRTRASVASTRPRSTATQGSILSPVSAASAATVRTQPSPRRSSARSASAPHHTRPQSNILLKHHRDSLEAVDNLGPIEDGESAYIYEEYSKRPRSSRPLAAPTPVSVSPQPFSHTPARVRFRDRARGMAAQLSGSLQSPSDDLDDQTQGTMDEEMDRALAREMMVTRSLSDTGPMLGAAEDEDVSSGASDRLAGTMDSATMATQRRSRASHSGEAEIHFRDMPGDSNLSRLAAAAQLGRPGSPRGRPHYMMHTKASQPARMSPRASKAVLARAQSKKMMDGAHVWHSHPWH